MSLLKRYRLIRKMNSGTINAGLSERRINFLKGLFRKHLSPETKRRAKCYWYDELITKAPYLEFTEEEQKVIDQITPITENINLKEFIMEMADLKKFAKEAGLSLKEIKGLDEDELIIAIISSVDSEKNYSDEFTEWYDELDEDYFNQADSIGEEGEEEEEEGEEDETKSQLIEAIEDCKKVSELKEILDSEEFGEIFEDVDPDKFKLTSKLKEAMLEAVENYFVESEEEEEAEEEENGNEELIAAIEKCKTLKKLQAIAEENEVFEGIKFKTGKGRGVKERDLDEVKEEMINLLSGEEEEEEEEKPAAKSDKKGKADKKSSTAIDMSNSPIDFDVDDFDVEELMEEVGKLPFLRLKTFAKVIGLTIKPGVKQDQIIELVEEQLQKIADGEAAQEKPEKKEKGKPGRKPKEVVKEEEEEEEEIEITEELIKDAIDGDDTEMLAEICESLGIKLSNIQKKSAKQMGVLALRQFGRVHGKKKELEKEDKTIDKEERQSVYQMIEEMVLEEEDEDTIIEAVSPIFKERGKKAAYIKKRVMGMIEIVKLDNDLE